MITVNRRMLKYHKAKLAFNQLAFLQSNSTIPVAEIKKTKQLIKDLKDDSFVGLYFEKKLYSSDDLIFHLEDAIKTRVHQ